MYSNHTIVGRLGKDPEMRYTPSGVAVCNFSVCVSFAYTDKEGTSHEDKTWYKVTTWKKQAEACGTHLQKGAMVLVSGSKIKASGYADREGEIKGSLELTADTVRFLSKPGVSDAVAEGQPEEDEVPETPKPVKKKPTLSEEDIPF